MKPPIHNGEITHVHTFKRQYLYGGLEKLEFNGNEITDMFDRIHLAEICYKLDKLSKKYPPKQEGNEDNDG